EPRSERTPDVALESTNEMKSWDIPQRWRDRLVGRGKGDQPPTVRRGAQQPHARRGGNFHHGLGRSRIDQTQATVRIRNDDGSIEENGHRIDPGGRIWE